MGPRPASEGGRGPRETGFHPSVTVGVSWPAPAAQAHDHRGKGQLALHAVLADAVQDIGGEVDVQVAEENDAARVLEAAGRSASCPLLRQFLPCLPHPAHLPPPRPLRPEALLSAQSSRSAEGTGSWGVGVTGKVPGRKRTRPPRRGDVLGTHPPLVLGGAITWAAAQCAGPAPRPCPRSRSPPGPR